MPERKIVDDSFSISRKRGNGILRREVWVDDAGRVVRYNLAYINHALYVGDNGRVLGYATPMAIITVIAWAWSNRLISSASRISRHALSRIG